MPGTGPSPPSACRAFLGPPRGQLFLRGREATAGFHSSYCFPAALWENLVNRQHFIPHRGGWGSQVLEMQ